jgi:hypothetical protein
MTKEEMKREIASKTPTFERLQQHGPMPTKTIDQIRGCHRERGWNRQIASGYILFAFVKL